jgi:chemotaxis protein methyltransferase CheR
MMDSDGYEYLRCLLHERSGLALLGDKQYLIESRLMPVARRHGHAGLSELVRAARNPGSELLRTDIVEAMTTNETFFFRDKTPFEHFTETMLPQLLQARSNRRRLRIWCAAASTGQEPYSLAMLLDENARKLAGWKVEIIATDISHEVLDKAKAGLYTQFEVQRGLPINFLMKYFKQVGDMWQVSPAIRQMVQFKPFNLLDDIAPLGSFDIIYCRNVLIYFDAETKADVLWRMADILAPDGYLLLGAAETILGVSERFASAPNRRGLYMPKESGGGHSGVAAAQQLRAV